MGQRNREEGDIDREGDRERRRQRGGGHRERG